MVPALLLTSHGALQFVTYEWLKRVAEPYHVPLLSYSVLGGVAKIVAGLATYPYQVCVRRGSQIACLGGWMEMDGWMMKSQAMSGHRSLLTLALSSLRDMKCIHR